MGMLRWLSQFSIVDMKMNTISNDSSCDENPTGGIGLLDFSEVLLWQKRKNTAALSVRGG